MCAQTDSWVQSKGLDPYYSLFTERINTLVAGGEMSPLYDAAFRVDFPGPYHQNGIASANAVAMANLLSQA